MTSAARPARSRLVRALRALGLVVLAAAAIVGGYCLFWTYYNPSVPLAEPRVVTRTPIRQDDIVIALAGDFAPTDRALPLIASNKDGYRYPYFGTAQLMRTADVAFANLEAPVTTATDKFWPYKKYIYKVAPEATAAWQWLGLDVVSLANNHVGDYRDQGVLDTVKHLDAADIAHVGGGATETAARQPAIFDVGGTKIGFLAYMEDTPSYNLYMRAFAVGDRPGSARYLRDDLVEDLRRLRPLVDVLIVSVHWGENYKPITAEQRAMARELASLGVDLVAGHHPHIAQAATVIDKTVVLYSVGNWAWGAIGNAELTIGLVARAHVTPRQGDTPGHLSRVDLVPILVQNRTVDYQPRPLVSTELPLLEPLLVESAKEGTPLLWDKRILYVPFGTAIGAFPEAPQHR